MGNRPPPAGFAPELFQTSDESPLDQHHLATLAANAAQTLEAVPTPSLDHELHTRPLLKQETSDYQDGMGLPQWPTESSVVQDISMEAPSDDIDPDSMPLSQQKSAGQSKKTTKTSKATDPEADAIAKPTKHSSKNEGQHTDRRYLCYLCDKLFTRRRSVRDHIAKIHNVKSWEPLRSLEVIVDPITGEPTEPIEDIIARGPPPPPHKTPKATKEKVTKEGDGEGPDVLDAAEPAEQPEETPTVEPEPVSMIEAEPPSSPPAAEPDVKDEDDTPAPARMPSPQPKHSPVPVIGKKRPAPEVTKPLPAAITKKGTAKKTTHTPNKKPKLSESESISEKGTPIRSPSATPAALARAPASKLKKQVIPTRDSPTPTSSRVASMEPASPSPSAADTPGSSNDDGEVFCLCRKGDNHSWMIACDGGCDDWFHGNCVHIRERDGDLIDKYICPNCMAKTGMQTTWKRMCRRKGCRKPARVFQDPPSKYCSKECGRMFFVELIRRGDPYIDTMKNDQYVVDGGRPKKMRKKRTHTEKGNKEKAPKAIPMVNGDIGDLVNSDSRLATPAPSDDEKSEYETDSSADDDQLPNRGGALRAEEVKAIIDKCSSIESWRDLGRKPDTPPREPDDNDITLNFDDFEKKKLEDTGREKAELRKKQALLEAREKMLNLIKTRSAGITEELKKEGPKDKKGSSKKDPCGFDPRLAWSEQQFNTWYERDGKAILESGRIGPPDEEDVGAADKKLPNGVVNGTGEDSDDESEEKEMPKKGGVCARNRCPRHRNWGKGGLAEIRFEQDLVRRGIRRCEEGEREIRDRAVVRAWERGKLGRWHDCW